MAYIVGEPLDGFIREQVATGRFASEQDVIRESLKLMQVREEKLKALRTHLHDAIDENAWHSPDDVKAFLRENE